MSLDNSTVSELQHFVTQPLRYIHVCTCISSSYGMHFTIRKVYSLVHFAQGPRLAVLSARASYHGRAWSRNQDWTVRSGGLCVEETVPARRGALSTCECHVTVNSAALPLISPDNHLILHTPLITWYNHLISDMIPTSCSLHSHHMYYIILCSPLITWYCITSSYVHLWSPDIALHHPMFTSDHLTLHFMYQPMLISDHLILHYISPPSTSA